MISFDNDFDGLLHDQSFNDQRKVHHQSFNDHRIFDRVTAPFTSDCDVIDVFQFMFVYVR